MKTKAELLAEIESANQLTAKLQAELDAAKPGAPEAGAPAGDSPTSQRNPTSGSVRHANPLMRYLRGEFIPSVFQTPPPTGVVTALWRFYVGNGTSLAGMGIRGADVAFMLCVFGYLELHCAGTVYAPKTAENLLPTAEELNAARATFRFVDKIPTRQEFYEIVKETRPTRASRAM